MGGNALASKGAKRVERLVAEKMFRVFKKHLKSVATQFSIDFRCEGVSAYRQKADFGDLDILVENTLFMRITTGEIVSALTEAYHADIPWVKNGPVLSLGLPLDSGGCLQVDLISTPLESFDFAAGYFAWNDLGNLVGRVAHRMGLKFGHDGLWLPVRVGSNLVGEVLVTLDVEQALRFLGFNSEVWSLGFDSLEDIYRFVAAGKRFSADLYPLEHRNHTARVRDRKRPVYMGFLKWLAEQENLNEYPWDADKSAYLLEIFSVFPEAKIKYQGVLQSYEHEQRVKARFNGGLVAELTGLSGKELGAFIGSFKSANSQLFCEIESVSDDDLRSAILNAHHKFASGLSVVKG